MGQASGPGEQAQGRRFRPGWKMTLFTMALLPVVAGLGFWQLERADEKRRYEEAYLARISGLPVAPGNRLEDFQRLKLAGRFEDDLDFLVDNQTHEGEVGFAVVSVFLAADGRRWLVNRGFLAGDRSRRSLPVLTTPSGRVTIVGVVWPELGLMPLFARDDWQGGWPKVVQRLEVERMAGMVDNALPREIRLEGGQPGVFEPAPLAMNMAASTHSGYAVQWFGLTLALIAGYLFHGLRRR